MRKLREQRWLIDRRLIDHAIAALAPEQVNDLSDQIREYRYRFDFILQRAKTDPYPGH